jgi:four helix bundle protein
MPTILRFEDIVAWRTARELTQMVYRLTSHGQFAKDNGSSNQMQRASVSIMSNIAKGFESRTNILFKEYPGRAKAPERELRAQAYIAKDVGYINEDDFSLVYEQCDKCSRQITGFMQYLAQQLQPVRDDGIEYNV